MKTKFSKQYILDNCGCYGIDKVNDLLGDVIEFSSNDILNLNIPLKDKYWFFCKKVFTKKQNQQIAISVAEIVLPIYEQKYPENKAPREAIEAAKLYIKGHLSLNELIIKRRAVSAAAVSAAAVSAAADYASAAYAVSDAAYAVSAAAVSAADAAASAAYAADAAAYAADAAASYKQLLLENLKNFIAANTAE